MATYPNFFIIGAPKCGTTSLAYWLSTHPNVFISPIKEPHYFYSDGKKKFINIKKRTEYEYLFSNVNKKQYAIGEASVFYLYSKYAVINILKELPHSKFIVMLRNPIEMAISLHAQELYSQNENIINFEDAWNLQKEREKGLYIPKNCKEPNHLLYGKVCSLGLQLEKIMSIIDKKNILIIFLDDIIQNPEKIYKSTLHFLNVDENHRPNFHPKNSSKKLRSSLIYKTIRAAGQLKFKYKIKYNFGIIHFFTRLNTLENKKSNISNDFRKILNSYFANDIKKIESITGKSLNHWTN